MFERARVYLERERTKQNKKKIGISNYIEAYQKKEKIFSKNLIKTHIYIYKYEELDKMFQRTARTTKMNEEANTSRIYLWVRKIFDRV